ncbi:hypothetical protein Daus18300_008149 [Diaporthe australafricana]|uniref:F-box domain-containing protein n=1 Tax=Diaporthe australafricana TaxID=127596 RepID=A0ABR3WJC3_9PEZI
MVRESHIHPRSEPRLLSPLEALPIEILEIFLSQMGSPEDLYAAIRASPLLLDVFLGKREHILIRTIQSALHPDIFMELLGFVHLPSCRNLQHVPQIPHGWDWDGTALTASEWSDLRRMEQSKFILHHQTEHLARIDQALAEGIQLFEMPDPRRPVGPEKLTFKQAVNTIARIYRHMRRANLISASFTEDCVEAQRKDLRVRIIFRMGALLLPTGTSVTHTFLAQYI